MRIGKAHILAWTVAIVCFVLAAVAISRTKATYVARARAEISKTDISPAGMVSFTRVDFARANRLLPMDMASRLRSHGTIRRALEHLGEPADDQAIEAIGKVINARVVAGTTLIEVLARAPNAERSTKIAGALLAAQDLLKQEQRARTADAALAALDASAKELREESRTVAEKLAAFDVRRSLQYARYSGKMETTLVDVAGQRAKVESSLRRLEVADSKDPEALIRNLEDLPQRVADEDAFAASVGFVTLRTSILNKRAEIANLRASYGEQSEKIKRARSELDALYANLRQYVDGQIVQLRAQLAAIDAAGGAIKDRIQARDADWSNVQNTELSPEYAALTLRAESIRGQIKEIEARRREITVFKQVFEPALTVIDPPRAGPAPEHAHRDTRLVFAGFGALLVGFSLSIVLTHRHVL